MALIDRGEKAGDCVKKIVLWSFVPTAIILSLVALVNIVAYQRVTSDLVMERNQELTRLSASQLATAIEDYTDRLDIIARRAGIYSGDPTMQRETLQRVRNRLSLFDGGVILLNTFGQVVAAEPERSELIGSNWSDRTYFRQLLRTSHVVYSDIVTDGIDGKNAIAVAVPVIGPQSEFVGALVGMFQVGATEVSTFYGDLVRLRIGQKSGAYLVDGNGRVIYHTDVNQVGISPLEQDVVQKVLDGGVGAQHARNIHNYSIVAGYAPVPGTNWGLIIEEKWASLIGKSQGYQQFLVALLILGLVIPGLVMTIGVRRITNPLTELIAAADKIAEGNFSRTYITPTGDEIETLATQFNQMATKLQESYTQLEQRVQERTRELEALNTVAEAVSRSLALDQTLDAALSESLAVMGVEAGGIYLLSEKSATLAIASHVGLNASLVESIATLHIGEGISGRVVESNQAIVVDDVSRDPRVPFMSVKQEKLRSLISVPLRSKDRVLGTLFAVTYAYRAFTQQEIDLLTAIGHQVGVAVDNAMLYEQAQQLAAMEERGRLARELHDSVTQSLYSLTLLAEGWRRLAAAGQLEDPGDALTELGELGQQALKEMRLLVYELRPPDLERDGLLSALQQRLSAVEKRSGVETRILVPESLELPGHIEEDIYRIAQEALNNTLKHASATSVTISLNEHPEHVELEIADNGRGFDYGQIQNGGGMGLANMKERSKKLRGAFNVATAPGEGTKICVEIPKKLTINPN